MKCPNCNKEIPDGSAYCNHCGSIVPHVTVQEDPPAYNSVTDFDSSEKKQPGKLKSDPILLVMLIISLTTIVIWGINQLITGDYLSSDKPVGSTMYSNNDTNDDYTDDSSNTDYSSYDDYDYETDDYDLNDYDDYDSESKPKKSKVKKPKHFKYKAKLSAGYYVAGINIPKGTYNLKLISGSGNVFSEDLNEIFGTKKRFGHIKKYNNLELDSGDFLEIEDNLVLQIYSKNATKKHLSNSNHATRSYTLNSGIYKCKRDIKAGVYNITLVNGSGNVYIPNIVNEIFSKSSHGITRFKNVPITKGAKLDISGCTLKLTPSKSKFEKNLCKK